MIERDIFERDDWAHRRFLLWLNYFHNIGYIGTCASTTADTYTEEDLRKEGTDISKRDFTGGDCTAWVYDLFRADEPYENRGVHPSGVGINRYRKFSDLTNEEQRYLKRQYSLSYLNAIDPFLVGVRDFGFSTANGEWRWNATLRHQPAPFGYHLGVNLFFKTPGGRYMHGKLNAYVNDTGASPGIEFGLSRHRTRLFNHDVFVKSRIAVWLQPENQLFRDEKSKPGGLISTRISIPIARDWEVFSELEAKSDGWVAGNEYLDDNVSVRFGVTKTIELKKR